VKKGGNVVLGVRGNVANFPTFEENCKVALLD
jgi:hypothetical protein